MFQITGMISMIEISLIIFWAFMVCHFDAEPFFNNIKIAWKPFLASSLKFQEHAVIYTWKDLSWDIMFSLCHPGIWNDKPTNWPHKFWQEQMWTAISMHMKSNTVINYTWREYSNKLFLCTILQFCLSIRDRTALSFPKKNIRKLCS